MTQTEQRNKVTKLKKFGIVNDHGPPTKKKKLSDKIKQVKDKPFWHLNLSNLMFHETKYNIGKIATIVYYILKEDNHLCFSCQFNLSSVSYISKRQ